MAKSILAENAAVLYLRMSSAKQDKSIPAQRDELLKLAKAKGYTVVREYVDPAISGDDTEKRVGFLALRERCEIGPDFSIILVWHEDRFSRNDPLEFGYWLRPIRASGVILETPTGRVDWESLGGRLLSLIGQEMRHDYLQQLSRNVTRGQLAAAKDGRGGTGGRPPAGYIHSGDQVVVVEAWAAIVRRIFAEYLKPGASLRSVVDLLNKEGIVTARGCKWSMSTLRAVLVNRKYTGDYVRFKTKVGKYHAAQNGEIVSRRRGASRETQSAPVVIADHHEAIIDRETFDKVQRKLTGQKRRTAHRSGHQYTFTGLLRCGDCGGPMGGAVKTYLAKNIPCFVYNCRNYHSQGATACHCNSVREDRLLKTVVHKVQTEVLSDEAIDRLVEAYRRRLAARRKIIPVDVGGRLQKQIDALDRQIDQGVNRVLSAPENLVTTIYAKIETLRQDRDRLQAQLDAAGKPERGSVLLDDQKVEEAAKVLRDLREAFADARPEEIRDLISPLVSKIELHFSHFREGKKQRNPLQYGTIFVRPTDPILSLMFATSSRTRRPRPRIAVIF